MGYETTICPSYPCLDPYCRYTCCQDYQYELEHAHPTQRHHHSHRAHYPDTYNHSPHHHRRYSTTIRVPPSTAALHEAHQQLKHRDALARELDRQSRQQEREKVEKEAKEQIENIARGKVEREKDAERGKKARDLEGERQRKREERKEERRGRERVYEESESGSESEDGGCGGRGRRRSWVSSRRFYHVGGREGGVRYVEKRYDSRGRRGETVLVTRQRAPSWLKLFMESC